MGRRLLLLAAPRRALAYPVVVVGEEALLLKRQAPDPLERCPRHVLRRHQFCLVAGIGRDEPGLRITLLDQRSVEHLVFQVDVGEEPAREPQRGLASRQTLLAVHPPVLEACVAQGVEHPHEPRREEGAPQLLLAMTDARSEAQDLRWRPAAVLALAVSPMALAVVVVLHEPVVDLDELGPTLCLGKMPVGGFAPKFGLEPELQSLNQNYKRVGTL